MIAFNKKINVKRTQPECDYINALVDQKIEQQMNKWNKKMNAKRNQPEFNSTIALLQHKIDQHVSWNEQMNAAYNGQLSKLQGDISTINSTIENIVADIDRNKKSLIRNNLHKAELEKYREYMDTSHEWQFTISNRVDNIERKALQVTELLNEIKVLENKIADIEQRGREKNIEISNLPENNDEDLYKVLEELCGLMEISVNLSDIESINRVPHMDKNDQRPRNIIVKFFTKRQRDKVLQNCKPTKGFMVMGKPHMVFINEHLTIRNKLLYKQCREAAKRNDFKYTWIKHGVILIRKSDISPVFAVRTHDEIAKIQ
ncbi:uncharacterized protein LOC131855104 [Achroia grisella]|uniref:uncharacterized protein LOC131855104 n=1 Tax=Achroia grisella TaxID=688607 RepID=UPI0027D3509E|nr:uncharacterized protein LOC131855104 [Achroia grisella]